MKKIKSFTVNIHLDEKMLQTMISHAGQEAMSYQEWWEKELPKRVNECLSVVVDWGEEK